MNYIKSTTNSIVVKFEVYPFTYRQIFSLLVFQWTMENWLTQSHFLALQADELFLNVVMEYLSETVHLEGERISPTDRQRKARKNKYFVRERF